MLFLASTESKHLTSAVQALHATMSQAEALTMMRILLIMTRLFMQAAYRVQSRHCFETGLVLSLHSVQKRTSPSKAAAGNLEHGRRL